MVQGEKKTKKTSVFKTRQGYLKSEEEIVKAGAG